MRVNGPKRVIVCFLPQHPLTCFIVAEGASNCCDGSRQGVLCRGCCRKGQAWRNWCEQGRSLSRSPRAAAWRSRHSHSQTCGNLCLCVCAVACIPSILHHLTYESDYFLIFESQIAAINGPVAGVGLALALSCDFRFAVQSAKITCAFSKLGLTARAWVIISSPTASWDRKSHDDVGIYHLHPHACACVHIIDASYHLCCIIIVYR
jgi:hypothetical protein